MIKKVFLSILIATLLYIATYALIRLLLHYTGTYTDFAHTWRIYSIWIMPLFFWANSILFIFFENKWLNGAGFVVLYLLTVPLYWLLNAFSEGPILTGTIIATLTCLNLMNVLTCLFMKKKLDKEVAIA